MPPCATSPGVLLGPVQILIGGQDITRLRQSDLRSLIAYLRAAMPDPVLARSGARS